MEAEAVLAWEARGREEAGDEEQDCDVEEEDCEVEAEVRGAEDGDDATPRLPLLLRLAFVPLSCGWIKGV